MSSRLDQTTDASDRLSRALTAHWWRERHSQPEMTDADHREFEAWLKVDSRNAEAFERATSVWGSLSAISADDYSAAARRETWAERLRRFTLGAVGQRPSSGFPGPAALALSVTLMLTVGVLTLVVGEKHASDADRRVSYSTAVGEAETVTLSDGTVLTLGPGSAVEVAFDQEFRDINLLRGAVFLDVTSDANRPLRAIAGDLRAMALGTSFSIKRADGVSRVGVAEGVVRVSYPTVIAGKPSGVREVRDVTEGEQIAALHAKGLQEVDAILPDSVGAWRNSKLDYVRATVTELVDDLHRLSTMNVSIEDPEGVLAEETFTAYFDASDVRALVRKLPAVLPVEVLSQPDGALIICPIKSEQ